MNDNRYTPPAAKVSDVPARVPLPERPSSVVLGVRLMWLSAACGVPASIYELFEPPGDVTTLENVLGNVIGVVVAFGIAYVFNTAAWRGRNWGRWVNAVLVTLGSLGTLMILRKLERVVPAMMPGYFVAQYAFQNLIGAFGVGSLFTTTSNAWFREMRDRR